MSPSKDNTTTRAAAIAWFEADVKGLEEENADLWQKYESETARLERE